LGFYRRGFFPLGFFWEGFRRKRFHLLALGRALRPLDLRLQETIENPPNSLGSLVRIDIPIQLP
jgi:hypothetical protein